MVLGAIEGALQPVLGPPGETESRLRSGDPVEMLSTIPSGAAAATPIPNSLVSGAKSVTRVHDEVEETAAESGGDPSQVPSASDLGSTVASGAAEAAPGALMVLLTGSTPGGNGQDDEQQGSGGPGLLTLGAVGAAAVGLVGLLVALAGD